jgi:hypothetical protein
MEKIIPRKETKTFDPKVLNKDKFSMTLVLNKQRFEQLDRLLRSKDLYTLATKTRPPPISTPSNEFRYVPSMVKCTNGRNKTIPADSIANYDYDLTRLETVMRIAFDKALHHQSQGFVDHDPVRMYSDMRTYFHGQDSNGIKAARLALDKLHPLSKNKTSLEFLLNTRLSHQLTSKSASAPSWANPRGFSAPPILLVILENSMSS